MLLGKRKTSKGNNALSAALTAFTETISQKQQKKLYLNRVNFNLKIRLKRAQIFQLTKLNLEGRTNLENYWESLRFDEKHHKMSSLWVRVCSTLSTFSSLAWLIWSQTSHYFHWFIKITRRRPSSAFHLRLAGTTNMTLNTLT